MMRKQRGFISTKSSIARAFLNQVWEYQIGGYQVAEKYLKNRKKRELSQVEIEH